MLATTQVFALLAQLGCEQTSVPLPEPQLQPSADSKLIKYGELEFFLVRGSERPEQWLTITASPQSQAAQACAKSQWSPKTWVTVTDHSVLELQTYLGNLIKSPFPSPKDAHLCPQ